MLGYSKKADILLLETYYYADYRVNKKTYKSKSGYELCSNEHLLNIEKVVFGKNLNVKCDKYTSTLKKEIEDVPKQIVTDLKKGIDNNDYITKKSSIGLTNSYYRYETIYIKCEDYIKLAQNLLCYKEIDKASVKRLQINLNNWIGAKIVVDGIIDNYTIMQMNKFYDILAKGQTDKLVLSSATCENTKSRIKNIANYGKIAQINGYDYLVTFDFMSEIENYNYIANELNDTYTNGLDKVDVIKYKDDGLKIEGDFSLDTSKTIDFLVGLIGGKVAV